MNVCLGRPTILCVLLGLTLGLGVLSPLAAHRAQAGVWDWMKGRNRKGECPLPVVIRELEQREADAGRIQTTRSGVPMVRVPEPDQMRTQLIRVDEHGPQAVGRRSQPPPPPSARAPQNTLPGIGAEVSSSPPPPPSARRQSPPLPQKNKKADDFEGFNEIDDSSKTQFIQLPVEQIQRPNFAHAVPKPGHPLDPYKTGGKAHDYEYLLQGYEKPPGYAVDRAGIEKLEIGPPVQGMPKIDTQTHPVQRLNEALGPGKMPLTHATKLAEGTFSTVYLEHSREIPVPQNLIEAELASQKAFNKLTEKTKAEWRRRNGTEIPDDTLEEMYKGTEEMERLRGARVLRRQWAVKNASWVIKVMKSLPQEVGVSLEKLISKDMRLRALTDKLCARVRYRGRKFIRLAKVQTPLLFLKKGFFRQEYVPGYTAEQIQEAIDFLRFAHRKEGVIPMEYYKHRDVLESFASRSRKHPSGFDLDEAQNKIYALEQFYRDNHDVVYEATRRAGYDASTYQANEVHYAGSKANQRRFSHEVHGIVVPMDYNLGRNVVWHKEEKIWVIIDGAG